MKPYANIDPVIKPLIIKLNDKGLYTRSCCAGVGECKSYTGRSLSKCHSKYYYPYISFDFSCDRIMLNELKKKCSERKDLFKFTTVGMMFAPNLTALPLGYKIYCPTSKKTNLSSFKRRWLKNFEKIVDQL